MLFSKDGSYPTQLPPGAYGTNEDGEVWWFQPLDGRPEAIAAAGFVAAPRQPLHDPRTQVLKWTGKAWELAPRPQSEIEQEVTIARAAALDALAAIRWQRQQTFIFNEAPALADDVTIGRVVAKIFSAQLSQSPAGNLTLWKFGPNNFAEVTIADLATYGQAINAHVQGCFDVESAKATKINEATSIAALDAIDLQAGWPI